MWSYSESSLEYKKVGDILAVMREYELLKKLPILNFNTPAQFSSHTLGILDILACLQNTLTLNIKNWCFWEIITYFSY